MRLYLFLAGALLGALATAHYYDAKKVRAELKQSRANTEYNNAITELSNEYYKLYQDANNRKPTVVFDGVRVQAKCNDTATTGVDNGANAARVELAERTVRGIAAVAEKHATQYEQCAVRLRAAQGILSKHTR